jgi:hypothetical protein
MTPLAAEDEIRTSRKNKRVLFFESEDSGKRFLYPFHHDTLLH